MSVVVRGMKNAFRNKIRTGAVVLILAIGIGLALSMLVANQAVANKIAQLKTEMGTTLTINPAGMQGFEGGGDLLTTDDLNTVKQLEHVAQANATLSLRMNNENDSDSGMMGASGTTSLESAVDVGEGNVRMMGPDGSVNTKDISIPIIFVGTTGFTDQTGKDVTIKEGRALQEGDTDAAVVGTTLAEKNNLEIGSTFKAHDEMLTVVGMFDQGTKFGNSSVFLPLETAQKLGDQEGEVATIFAQVDSIDKLESATSAIQKTLGEDKVDVSSAEQNVAAAISSLESVQTVSIIGFIASLIAAGIIILLIMTVIVRERRREIGVLKAIGGGDTTIVTQFMTEAMVLVVLGAAVGAGIALVSSNSIANALVTSSADSNQQEGGPLMNGDAQKMRGMGGGSGAVMKFGVSDDTEELIGDVATSVGLGTFAYGLLATFAIALVGSALPAWLIAKVRPAEVLRGE